MSPPPIYINGRFVTQTITGVQRFATEITAALQAIPSLDINLLVPGRSAVVRAGSAEDGRHGGHLWEQLELPRLARNGYLINLGNTAPLLVRRQLVVIHDTGVFSTPEVYSWKFRTWYKLMQHALALRRTHLVTVSEFSRQEIARHLGISPQSISVIPEGADHMDRIAPDNMVLSTHRLRPRQFVLIVGSLASHKNLASLNALAKMLTALELPLVIPGRLGSAAFQSAGTQFLPAPAKYIGRVTDQELKALYAGAACFVFPSIYEGFGLPLVEAMACGCPAIAADIPALREAGGTAALYCNPRNPDDIASQVTQLLQNDALRTRLKEDGLRRAHNMTWQSAAESLATIIIRHRGDAI